MHAIAIRRIGRRQAAGGLRRHVGDAPDGGGAGKKAGPLRRCKPLSRLAAAAAAALYAATSVAQPPPAETPLTMDSGLEPKEGRNVSGAACAPHGGACLLVGDEMRIARLFRLELAPGAGRVAPAQPVYLLPPTDPADPEDDEPESDVEGVAHADGTFFIVGSHSRSRRGALEPARHLLFRIPAQALADPRQLGTPDAPAPAVRRISLDSILFAYPFDGDHFVQKPGEDGGHGLNIEAVAVRGNDLYLGFRGPVFADGALILRVELDALDAGLPQTPESFRVQLPHQGGDAGEQGIRDMAAVEGGFLLLSGRERRLTREELAGGMRERSDLFFWAPGTEPIHLAAVPIQTDPPAHDGELVARSPESLTVLEESSDQYRVLIMDDSPGGSAPRILIVPRGAP